MLTKTSLMLGLGETVEEVIQTMDDLRAAGWICSPSASTCDPRHNHLAVERFVSPAEFAQLRQAALQRGFLECVAGPCVRSSYRAEQALNRSNAGLNNVIVNAAPRPATRGAPLIRHLGRVDYVATWRRHAAVHRHAQRAHRR